jgi:hypothetical protein
LIEARVRICPLDVGIDFQDYINLRASMACLVMP